MIELEFETKPLVALTVRRPGTRPRIWKRIEPEVVEPDVEPDVERSLDRLTDVRERMRECCWSYRSTVTSKSSSTEGEALLNEISMEVSSSSWTSMFCNVNDSILGHEAVIS